VFRDTTPPRLARLSSIEKSVVGFRDLLVTCLNHECMSSTGSKATVTGDGCYVPKKGLLRSSSFSVNAAAIFSPRTELYDYALFSAARFL